MVLTGALLVFMSAVSVNEGFTLTLSRGEYCPRLCGVLWQRLQDRVSCYMDNISNTCAVTTDTTLTRYLDIHHILQRCGSLYGGGNYSQPGWKARVLQNDDRNMVCLKGSLTFGVKCGKTSQCDYGNGICLDGKCDCALGFSYHFQHKRCVKRRFKFGVKCDKRSQCRYRNGVCLDGRCDCALGFSYHFQHKRCVKRCSKYGKRFAVYANSGINGYNTGVRKVTSAKECMNECVKAQNFVCINCEFKLATKSCYLCNKAYNDIKRNRIEHGTEPGWTLFFRHCEK